MAAHLAAAAKYLQKLEAKSKDGATQRTITRALSLFTDNDGVLTLSQFERSLEQLGDALTREEAQCLFTSWEHNGCVTVELAVEALLSSTGLYTREYDVHRVGNGNKSNRASLPEGPFGGGAYAHECKASTGLQYLAEPAPKATHSGGNRSNASSVQGGIFAGPTDAELVAQQPRANKPYSNRSSVPGGIFGPDF